MKDQISAIIVTYNPDLTRLNNIIESLNNQVFEIIVIDNSDTKTPANFFYGTKVKYLYLDGNKGIAYAQNIGILNSANSSKFIITFDQDSKVGSNMVDSLCAEYHALVAKGVDKIACIGPAVVNERDGCVYQKYFNNSLEVSTNCFAVKSIISSGSFYPKESLAYIGLNKAHWFIDSIDIEWCYRARSLGYKVIMSKNVIMKHNLGSDDKEILFGKKLNYGAPIRLYYIYRNWIFSLKERSFTFSYKMKLIINMPIKFMLFSSIEPKKQRIKYMVKGVVDGVLGRSGKIE